MSGPSRSGPSTWPVGLAGDERSEVLDRLLQHRQGHDREMLARLLRDVGPFAVVRDLGLARADGGDLPAVDVAVRATVVCAHVPLQERVWNYPGHGIEGLVLSHEDVTEGFPVHIHLEAVPGRFQATGIRRRLEHARPVDLDVHGRVGDDPEDVGRTCRDHSAGGDPIWAGHGDSSLGSFTERLATRMSGEPNAVVRSAVQRATPTGRAASPRPPSQVPIYGYRWPKWARR